MKVALELKGHTDQWGRQSLYLRVYDGKRRYQITRYKLEPEQWDEKNQLVKTNYTNYKELNKTLRHLVVQTEQTGLEKKEAPTLTLYFYITQCLNEWEHTKKESTLRQQRSELSKLKRYAPDIPLHEVDAPWFALYRKWCIKQGNTENTQWKTFKFLSTVFKRAKLHKLIADNPMDLFDKPKYRDPQKQYLGEEEIKKIEKWVVTAPDKFSFSAYWFLIGCYTGLRFGDMQAFSQKKHIVNGRLVIYTQKTGTPISMELNKKLITWFKKIDHKPMHYSNENYNRVLKAVASEAELNKPISAHWSRHTFATLALTKGVPLEYVSKMMGHTSIRITAIYAKITGTGLDEQMKKLYK